VARGISTRTHTKHILAVPYKHLRTASLVKLPPSRQHTVPTLRVFQSVHFDDAAQIAPYSGLETMLYKR